MELIRNNYIGYGWFTTITYSAYWVTLIYYQNENLQGVPRTGYEILIIRMIHFGLMGISCLLFTFFAFLMGYLTPPGE